MPPIQLLLPDLAATERLGHAIATALRPGDAVLLTGPLGAGKTAVARALLRASCRDPALIVPSPSFTLVQSYDGADFPLHHFDLWRMAGPASLAELGWDEARDGVVLVEWPDRLGTRRPDAALEVALTPDAGDARVAVLSNWPGHAGWWPG